VQRAIPELDGSLEDVFELQDKGAAILAPKCRDTRRG
jgi:hypothetical protein